MLYFRANSISRFARLWRLPGRCQKLFVFIISLRRDVEQNRPLIQSFLTLFFAEA